VDNNNSGPDWSRLESAIQVKNFYLVGVSVVFLLSPEIHLKILKGTISRITGFAKGNKKA
jgi:hypothetical protein